MSESFLWDVFVSHNKAHRLQVKQMVHQWRACGLQVFFDEDCIEPGEDIGEGIERGIQDSRHVVLVLTPAAVRSRWVALEAACAMYTDPDSRDRRIIPLMLEQTPLDEIRLAVRRLSMIDLTNPDTAQFHYERLLAHLRVNGECPRLPNGHPKFEDSEALISCAPSGDPGGGLAVATEVVPVEITINRNFRHIAILNRIGF